MYIPIKPEERNRTLFLAIQLLKDTDWLKDILSCVPVARMTNICPLDKILTDNMGGSGKDTLL